MIQVPSGTAGPSIFLAGCLDPKQFMPSVPCLVDHFPTGNSEGIFWRHLCDGFGTGGLAKRLSGLHFGADKLRSKGWAGRVYNVNLV